MHNPNDYPITFYKKATKAALEGSTPPAPGNWNTVTLQPGRAMYINCDDVARLLTNNPSATFIGTYGIGVTIEGFVVITVGPQTVPGRGNIPYANLDVQAEYVRSSEVLKKDINYQAWWWWWWWPQPWRLGYAYNRLVPVNANANIDCRGALYDALNTDASAIANTNQRNATLAALQVGRSLDPSNPSQLQPDTQPALVALIGGCDKIIGPQAGQVSADISYVLLSNKGPTDPDPITGIPPVQVAATYPWVPGRWYDLPVVMPQNVSTDLDNYFRQWQVQRWLDAGAGNSAVQSAMPYYFPYWCRWGRWWWWWNGGDCEDIGVGEGESLDVEQVTPLRIFMAQWPPVNP